jgi:hypothetical protein
MSEATSQQSGWDASELEQVGGATELQLASRRPDGTLRPYTTMWVVRVGGDLYVRSAYGPSNPWYRRAKASGRGRIRAGEVERNVSFEEAAPAAQVLISTTWSPRPYHQRLPSVSRWR